MKQALAILGCAFALAASAYTHAEPIYTYDSGTWSLRGYADRVKPDNNACVLSSRWVDGKEVKVNVFPKYNGAQNVTMTVYNPQWNFAMSGNTYETNVDFYSSKYATRNLDGYVQVKAANRLIFRRMNETFSQSFVHYDTMVVFAGTQNQLSVDLTGTANLTSALDECIQVVLYPDYED